MVIEKIHKEDASYRKKKRELLDMNSTIAGPGWVELESMNHGGQICDGKRLSPISVPEIT